MNNKPVAVITGAGGGIGSAIAKTVARLGYNIACLGGNNIQKLESTQKSVSEISFCQIYPCNLNQIDKIKDSVLKIHEDFGRIDVVINNAGVALSKDFKDTTLEQYDNIMNVNCRAPYFTLQYCLPYLLKSNCATVINIGSVVSKEGYPLQSAYSASKHALIGWTKSFAKEYYDKNIRTYIICPGGVYTDMVKTTRPDLTPEGMIMPEDIADIVEFYLTHRSNAIIDEISVHRSNKIPF